MLRRLKPLLVVMATMLLAALVSGCTNKTAATPGGQDAGQDKSVVISYNTPAEWANWKSVLKSFEEQTGIKAPSDNKNSGQTVAQLLAEKVNPQCDVAYYGITYGVKAAESGLLAGYQPQHGEEIPAELHAPDWTWFTLHYGVVAFVVNTDALGGAPVPQSFNDLLKPEYKGKVGFLDPTSAFTGYASCVAANIALGGSLDNWDPGIAYLKKLEANGAVHPKQTATAQIEKGEIPIMIDYDFNGYRMRYVDQASIQVVIPQEGSITVPYVISLVNNAPRQENAKKFLDYCMSDEGQAAFADGFVVPIRKGVMKADTQSKFLPSADYDRAKSIDFAKMGTAQEQFTKLWLSEVANAK
jgi:putative spermidine/putrescine transport system substrate-binding protein